MTDNLARLKAALADRYTIESQLGVGGMATVYLAEDVKHKRKVAVKVLRPELAAVLGAERFVQEIETTANLQHPHILPLFDSGEADGFLYYVMPYIEGETLRGKLNRETQLGIDEAVKITTEVADALDYAHRHNVIHRDIKPENILLHDGRPMVADFGIALAVSAAAGGRMTETGLSLGTPHYMSPEQATAEKDLTNRADIYSLGCVLYEMLTGEPPHTGKSAQQIIMKIVTDEARPITELRKSVPPNVAAAVAKSLEKLAADRFSTAKEFSEALANPAFMRPATAGARGAAAAERDWKQRFAVPLVGVAAVITVMLLWGWLGPARQTAPPSPWRTALDLSYVDSRYSTASISADGSVLVYGVLGPNGPQVWMLRADATEPTPIAGTEGGWAPSLSPDGGRVAFLVPNQFYVVPLEGGTRTLLTDSGGPVPLVWTDNEHIVYARAHGLTRLSATGGPLEQLTTVDSTAGELLHLFPGTLPDKGIVFTIFPIGAGFATNSGQIAMVGPDGGEHTVLMDGFLARYAHPDHLLVLRGDGTIVAVPFDADSRTVNDSEALQLVSGLALDMRRTDGWFSVSTGGRLVYGSGDDPVSELVSVDRSGGAAPVDSSWTGSFSTVALSHDARLVAVTSGTNEIIVRDLISGGVVRQDVPGSLVDNAAFSPDGNALFVAALDRGVYRMDLRGTEPLERLIDVDAASELPWVLSPAVSSDGTLYYSRHGNAGSIIFASELDEPETAERMILRGARAPAPSPDGRWLAYHSNESGVREVYVRSTDPSRAEQWRISRSVVSLPSSIRWSPDGTEIFYTSIDSLFVAEVSGGSTFQASEPRALFSTAEFDESFDVYPDGRFLMIRQIDDGGEGFRFVMIEDWRSVLQR